MRVNFEAFGAAAFALPTPRMTKVVVGSRVIIDPTPGEAADR